MPVFIFLLAAMLPAQRGNACDSNLSLPLRLSCSMPDAGGRQSKSFPVEISKTAYMHGHEQVDIISVFALGNQLALTRKDNPLLVNTALENSVEDSAPRLPAGEASVIITHLSNGQYIHSASNEEALICRRGDAAPDSLTQADSASLCGFDALLRASRQNLSRQSSAED